jgi:hypothetical protein
MTKTRDLADLGGGFIQAGTGAVQRTVESKLQDTVSVKDFGAVGDAARLNQALATGNLVVASKDDYVLEGNVTSGTGALFIEPGSTFDRPDRLLPRGKTSDLGNGVNLWRFQDRVFIGGANKVSDTATPVLDGFGIAGDPSGINSDYLERGSALISSSAYGGLGGSFATKQSLQYSAEGYTTWASGQSVSIGAKRGYYEKLYTATTSGTTGGTPPSHTSGTASDGGVTWQFDNYTYMVPIGLASVADADVSDGHSCWALYLEGLRRSAGGTLLTSEIAVKNKGSNVTSNPYSILPGGATIGIWFAGGGDGTLGAPTNPSTAAIAIGRNSQSWNTGIVFGSTAITSGGSAIAFAANHKITWHATDGLERAYITSERTTTSNGGGIKFTDNSIQFLPTGTLGLVVDSTPTDNSWTQLQGGSGFSRVLVGSSLTNSALHLQAKGTGNIRLNSPLMFAYAGFTSATTPANFTADRYMIVYDSSGTPFYIPARLATW